MVFTSNVSYGCSLDNILSKAQFRYHTTFEMNVNFREIGLQR